jgi:predicted ATPase
VKSHIASHDEYIWQAEAQRIEGELLRLEGAVPAQIESCFVKSLSTATRQGAKSFQLRTATSLANFWREQGRRAEARDLLAPVYGWFTEGFDTVDLKDAKALIAQVSAQATSALTTSGL